MVVYTPTEVRLKINVAKLPAPLLANWINPRTGERQDVLAVLRGSALECPAGCRGLAVGAPRQEAGASQPAAADPCIRSRKK